MAAERIEVTGIVQGVGFRPFVYRLATEAGLSGFVGNDSSRVFIEVYGPQAAVDDFVRRLEAEAPPLASIDSVSRAAVEAKPAGGFSIVASEHVAGERTLVPPDTAVCDACLAEMFDPRDRRHLHPFITCTNCGPRFTIITGLPYDRPDTTMAGFPMCEACAAEYEDPGDRRYHAQPISCHDCGPSLTHRRDATVATRGQAIDAALEDLSMGRVVAMKGIGGYHLVCDARNDAALALLRERKRRPDKPFGIMVGSLDHARAIAQIDASEANLLLSPARPMVLVERRADAPLSPMVAPGNPLVGVMLPYAPLHHLLFARQSAPLVMTSGNVSGEPIIHRDDDAIERLGPLCDAILLHDRPIHLPCDDSVVRVLGDRLLPIRRGRGYAPVPVPLSRGSRTALTVGGELKNTFCLASEDHAWVSQHIGDMENIETLEAFEVTLAAFESLYGVAADVVAADAHPGYLASRWARRRTDGDLVEVQHHHAHVASVMAEARLDPHRKVIGFAFDGTGYGGDGTIWGGEVLVADADGYERVASLRPIPLPGGDASIRNPYRVAIAHLVAAGIPLYDDLPPVRRLEAVERGLLERQLDTGFNCVDTTSAGRLFDAVASLLGLRHTITYEAQAAIDLEVAATHAADPMPYAFGLRDGWMDQRPVLVDVVRDVRSGADTGAIALGFHAAVADAVVRVAEATREATGLDTAVLSGGVFQNALLTSMCVDGLAARAFEVLTHRLVPPNDGGLSLGQAFIAVHGRAPGGSGGAADGVP